MVGNPTWMDHPCLTQKSEVPYITTTLMNLDSYFFFFVVLGIEPRGVLPPRYAAGPIFFILYFETGSHEVVEGLTKEREREREREI